MLELGNEWRQSAAHPAAQVVLSTSKGGYLQGDPYGSSDLLPIGGDFSAIDSKFSSIFDENSDSQ
jgi:hypothetical protein